MFGKVFLITIAVTASTIAQAAPKAEFASMRPKFVGDQAIPVSTTTRASGFARTGEGPMTTSSIAPKRETATVTLKRFGSAGIGF